MTDIPLERIKDHLKNVKNGVKVSMNDIEFMELAINETESNIDLKEKEGETPQE